MLKFENKTNGRFYYLYIKKDLLNDLVLCVNYGGRNSGNNISRHKTIASGNRDCLESEINRLAQRRIKRGYELVC